MSEEKVTRKRRPVNRSRYRILQIMRYLKDNLEDGSKIDLKLLQKYLDEDDRKTCNKNNKKPPDLTLILEDLKAMSDMGIGGVKFKAVNRRGHYNYTSPLSNGELMLIINIICSVCYLTKDKARELIQHLCDAMTFERYKKLPIETDIVLRNKTYNDSCIENIDLISEAIRKKKMIRFSYANYDENGEFWYLIKVKKSKYEKVMVETKEHIPSGYIMGRIYVVSPYKIVWDNSQCYVICIQTDLRDRSQTIINFRADKIFDLSIEIDKDIEKPDTDGAFYDPDTGTLDTEKYLRSIFEMYGKPELTDVTFVVSKKLIGAMYDKFGTRIDPVEYGKTHFKFTAKIQVSKTFYGWTAKYLPNDLRIIAPDEVISGYRKHLKKIDDSYQQ